MYQYPANPPLGCTFQWHIGVVYVRCKYTKK